MNYLLHNYIPENTKPWKSAYEIQSAALEHEKLRYHMIDQEQPGGLDKILSIPLYILSIFLG